MNDELSGRDLDRAIAEAMGGPLAHREWYWFRNADDGALDIYAPGQEPLFCDSPDNHFSTSLDALSNGPERLLLEAEHWMVVDNIDGPFEVEWWSNRTQRVVVRADTEPLARARAALAALKALRAPAEEAGRDVARPVHGRTEG